MNFELERIFPESLSSFNGPQFVRITTALILCVMVLFVASITG